MVDRVEYQRRKSMGICGSCGKRRAEPGRVECARCASRSVLRVMRSRKEHQDNYQQYKKDHREESLAYSKQYRQNHSDERSAYNRQYKKDHPDVVAAHNQARRARIAGSGGSFTAQEWQDMKTYYNRTCLACGRREPEVKLHADHVVPLIRGGSSNIGNIQPLCGSCNSSKGGKIADYRGAVGRGRAS